MNSIANFIWPLLLLPCAASAHPGHDAAEAGGGGFAVADLWFIPAILYLLLLLLQLARGRLRQDKNGR